MKRKIIIGSRESRLAVIQSEMVRDFILEHNEDAEVSLLTMKTEGDKILDRTLDKIGGKGLFVKELDRALKDGRTDLSVHSLKDMPMEISQELPLVAFSKREDARDVLVLPEGKDEWEPGLPIGCSSRRRILQLQELYPEAEFKPVRGNVLTRLGKLDGGEYSALVLAAAGLKRLGLEKRISRCFEPEEIIPAAGQGILAVQGRAGEDYVFLKDYNHPEAEAAAVCERAFVRELDGGCSSPIAAHARIRDGKIHLLGLYYDEMTGKYQKGSRVGEIPEAEDIGRALAKELRTSVHGKVWLVGAGPSDPGLFTLKGKRVLEQAEVVVYDALVGQGILNMIPESAELINVGKRASNHLMKQEDISKLLVKKALEGKRVVRLKGGDPFLFGRGGEELELLVENQISCEVVPGVTSALAVPAYNGIPVTHRDYCSSLHIITGHKRKGQEYDIDFDALVRTKGTLVFLMGAAALEDICRGLMEHGMEPDMPAAILQKGTTAAQKRIVATVRTLARETAGKGIETPAIIVVGKVCQLADDFAWYEKLPLFGRKILVTRPKELISQMADRLRKKGAEVLELPAIRTEAIKDNALFWKCLSHVEDYDWLVFTSPTGVRIFFEEMERCALDVRKLSGAKIAAIGTGSAKELKKHGILADLIPEVYEGGALGAALARKAVRGERILIPRAAIGSHELIEELEKKEGLIIDDIATYDTFYENQTLIDEKAEFEKGNIDYAVFTSASTVRGFAEAVPGLDFSMVKAVCIGKKTKEAADAYGMQTFVSEKATMDSVLEKVEELCKSSN